LHLLTFLLARTRYAIPADDVIEIVRAVALTPLPAAPRVVAGLLNLRGLVVPVFEPRIRFALPARPMEVGDHLIIARAGPRIVALHVDRADDLRTIDAAAVEEPHTHLRSPNFVSGVVAVEDGLILIHDLATFLSEAEAEALEQAVAAHAEGDAAAAPGAAETA
jgi:purine-binding chemotaxis protein CheW